MVLFVVGVLLCSMASAAEKAIGSISGLLDQAEKVVSVKAVNRQSGKQFVGIVDMQAKKITVPALPRVAQLASSCVRSIGNLELILNLIGRLVLESARTPGFRCLRHTGSLNPCHPTKFSLSQLHLRNSAGTELVIAVTLSNRADVQFNGSNAADRLTLERSWLRFTGRLTF